jgi:TonB family protein
MAAAGLGRALAEDAPSHASDSLTWAAKVSERLKLDVEQQAAFQDFMSETTDRSAQSPAVSADQFRAMTAPKRQDYIAGRIAIDLKIAKARSKALHQFYDFLSADQQNQFDVETAPLGGQSLLATVVDQPVPDKPNYNLPSHTEADWLIKPSPDMVARIYPMAAQAKNVGGAVMITCTSDEDGYLTDCVVDSEEPKGLGFGNAALEMSAYLRMIPATNYGVPIRSSVSVPINFIKP